MAVNQPRLSIVVPIFNEERTLETLMRRLIDSCGEYAQLVFVDDGSTDATPDILRRMARQTDTVLRKPNGGKGSAVRLGYQHARGSYTIVQDADLEYSPEEIPGLLQYAESKNVPAVFGSRRLKGQRRYAHIAYYIGGCLLTYAFNLLYGMHLTDQPTCYKLIKTDILRSLPLTENDFRFDAEIASLLARRGVAIVEFPITYHPRSAREGKKIGIRDWLLHFLTFFRVRFRSLPHDLHNSAFVEG